MRLFLSMHLNLGALKNPHLWYFMRMTENCPCLLRVEGKKRPSTNYMHMHQLPHKKLVSEHVIIYFRIYLQYSSVNYS